MMILGGIDAGGTSTKCILVDGDGKLLAECMAGPANYQVVGLPSAVTEIKKAVQLALQQAGLTKIDHLGIGLAGGGRPEDLAKIDTALQPLTEVSNLYLTDDGEIAVLGAHRGRAGIAIIAGTGSIVYGIREDGVKVRRGGWGPILGDEGSGFWIGLSALKSIIKAEEGRGPTTLLTQRVLEYLQIDDLRRLIPLVYQNTLPRKLIASLTPLVVQAMNEGDGVARRIVEEGLDELVLTVQAVYQELDPTFETRVIGGLFQNQKIFELFSQKMREAGDYVIDKPELPPVYGAVFFAAKECGIPLKI